MFVILAEFGHSDRNGGIWCKKRKNSAKIGMVGSYGTPLGYLQRSIGSSQGWFALKDSRILCQGFRGVLREQDWLRPRRHCRLPPPEFPPTVHRMAMLREISSVELRSFIMLSAPKSCELDSLPASLIQDYVDDLLPFLTLLCNRSLQEGVLPDSQKRSVVFP